MHQAPSVKHLVPVPCCFIVKICKLPLLWRQYATVDEWHNVRLSSSVPAMLVTPWSCGASLVVSAGRFTTEFKHGGARFLGGFLFGTNNVGNRHGTTTSVTSYRNESMDVIYKLVRSATSVTISTLTYKNDRTHVLIYILFVRYRWCLKHYHSIIMCGNVYNHLDSAQQFLTSAVTANARSCDKVIGCRYLWWPFFFTIHIRQSIQIITNQSLVTFWDNVGASDWNKVPLRRKQKCIETF